MRCEEVREILPAYGRDGDTGLPVRRHLSRCADCSAELARYNSLARSLEDLRTQAAEPPAELFHQLASIPYRTSRAQEVRTHVTRNRNRYATGVAVAVIGAAGAAFWKTRRGRVATA